MKNTIKFNPNLITIEDHITPNLPVFKDAISKALMVKAKTEAEMLKAYMKMNRPWKDRTGAAKAGLNCEATQIEKTVIDIALFHGVEYGIWLELAHEQNYAIVVPTKVLKEHEVLQSLTNLLNTIRLRIGGLK